MHRSARTLGGKMNRIALAFTLLLIASASGAQQPTCARNAGGLFEDIGCAAAALKVAERELDGTYSQLLALLSAPEAAAGRSGQPATRRATQHKSQGFFTSKHSDI